MSLDLSAKTTAELKALLSNAEAVLAGANTKLHARAEEFRAAAEAALASRRVAPPGQRAEPDPALDAAVARIKAVAAEALKTFDLTPETAKARGITTPHALLASNGAPKTGGGVRTKKFRRCPYISYRGPGGIAMLQYAVPPGEGAEGFWSGGLVAVGSAESKTGFDAAMEPDAAVAAFLKALSELAPARS
ncbi:hypothetical protein KTR66_04260 [Roseococcus sp. SDR]|uniref:hypothetical protein n=1 Tax=Roseococcus sp. SDR TaxID=2835532 RepID=UPI001BCEA3A1|nr:hypothetical protein [Roseococcus sp. SDR]MBS7789193.1 hypothetical protein [Roseococcus sp. SDR]MBV1844507.1 hypothetical protein [Roseococcus sp. SDR]